MHTFSVKYHGIAAKAKQPYHQQILSFLIKQIFVKIKIIVVILCVQMCSKEVTECRCVKINAIIYLFPHFFFVSKCDGFFNAPPL